MSKEGKFVKVKKVDPWRKLSIALWPKDASRSFKTSFDLTHALEFKKSLGSTWTQVLSYALVQTMRSLPEKHRFIHAYQLKTRPNIDLFIRMSVKDESQNDSLWSIYLRGAQDLSFQDFSRKFNELKEKYQGPSNRMGQWSKLINWIPSLVLIVLVHVMDHLMRLGVPVPVLHKIAYPSISLSNLGSVATPETEPLKTPLSYPPLNIVIGEIHENKVHFIISADHRVLDGKDIGIFIEKFQETLNQMKWPI